ncbi:YwqG family protein [Entamoeba marina]
MENTIPKELLNKIIGEITTTTTLPTIELSFSSEETTVFNSKIGGKPYLPKDFEYPKTGDNDAQPLVLLAQINFSEFEELEDFPTSGILQFYIGNDDLFGVDFDYPTNTSGFRVIYHENIITDESLLMEPPIINSDYLPFTKCVKLVGKKVNMTMTYEDFRFHKLVKKYASKYGVDENELDTELCEGEYLSRSKTRIGGYGGFSQEDPRYLDSYSDYLIPLFTSESEGDIMWGDCGVANFFIKRDDLLKKNFNDIFYTWDCC